MEFRNKSDSNFNPEREAVILQQEARKIIRDPLPAQRPSEYPLRIFNEALPLLKIAVSLDPENYSTRIDLSCLFEHAGNAGAALYHLKSGLALRPELEIPRLGVIYLLCREKKFEEAALYAEEGTVLNPETSRLWIALGHCSLQTQRYTRALTAYQKALETMTEEDMAPLSPDEQDNLPYADIILQGIKDARNGIRFQEVVKRFFPKVK